FKPGPVTLHQAMNNPARDSLHIRGEDSDVRRLPRGGQALVHEGFEILVSLFSRRDERRYAIRQVADNKGLDRCRSAPFGLKLFQPAPKGQVWTRTGNEHFNM